MVHAKVSKLEAVAALKSTTSSLHAVTSKPAKTVGFACKVMVILSGTLVQVLIPSATKKIVTIVSPVGFIKSAAAGMYFGSSGLGVDTIVPAPPVCDQL